MRSVLSSQFFCKPKTVFLKKSYIKNLWRPATASGAHLPEAEKGFALHKDGGNGVAKSPSQAKVAEAKGRNRKR